MLAFAAERSGVFDIFTMDVGTGAIVQRSFTEEYDENPFWSPNGKAIAFSGKVFTDNAFYQEQIFVVDIDTNHVDQITSGSQNIAPSWSPDGEELAFLSSRTGSWAIYTMKADGSRPTKHTDGLGYIDQPYWSPFEDMVILADRENIATDSEIIRIDIGQFGYQNISQNSAEDIDPAWSPDGTRIVFVSDRDGNPDIYVMQVDGSNQTRITTTNDWELLPRWSPDGSHIAFQSHRNGNWDIYLMNSDGSGVVQLTEHPAPDVSPAWSPDGRVIAFVTLRNDDSWQDCQDARGCNSEIYLKDLTTGQLTRLTDNSSADVSPAWQPQLR